MFRVAGGQNTCFLSLSLSVSSLSLSLPLSLSLSRSLQMLKPDLYVGPPSPSSSVTTFRAHVLHMTTGLSPEVGPLLGWRPSLLAYPTHYPRVLQLLVVLCYAQLVDKNHEWSAADQSSNTLPKAKEQQIDQVPEIDTLSDTYHIYTI